MGGLTAFSIQAPASGPPGAPEPGYGALLSSEGCLPLRAMDVEAHVVGLLYRLRLSQTFVNAYPVPPSLERSGGRPRDVVILLDRSGSMNGWKMACARRAAALLVESLTEHDRFGVVAFDDRREALFENLRAAGPWERQRAAEFLRGVEARGGTEIAPALKRARGMLPETREFRERVLVLVTDGHVGNEEQLLLQVQGFRDVRIFTVGIDRAVSGGLLDRMARVTGGLCALVESEERLAQALRELHHRIGQPVLADITLPGLQATELTPVPGDAFAGAPAFVYGKLAQMPTGQVRVTATRASGASYELQLPVHQREERMVTTAWARARILDLQDRFAAGADVAAGITAFSLRWGVLSRFTAFSACDTLPALTPGTPVAQITVPVEKPSGWDDGQERRAERWPVMQDTRSKIFELTQDVSVNKARHLDRMLHLLRKLLALVTRCPVCEGREPVTNAHRHDDLGWLREDLDSGEWVDVEWRRRLTAIVTMVTETGFYECMGEAVEILLVAIEEFERELDAPIRGLPAAGEKLVRDLTRVEDLLQAERRKLADEWGYL